MSSTRGCAYFMELAQHLDVSYLPSAPPNTRQTFDIYLPLKHPPDTPADTSALVCFIHGGAWRAEDKADHAALACELALSTGYPVALPNYRLTPREPTPDNCLHHPAHAQDLLQFLEFLLSWHKGNEGSLPSRPTRLFLIGHSCSAHMLCTIFSHMSADSERVCPSDELVRSTIAIVMSEGIYDIDSLLSSFPGYRTWFIENTFGRSDSYENVSAIRATIDSRATHICWFVMHSKGDTLVDERQSQEMYHFLRNNSRLVSKSFDELESEHNDILKTRQYVDIISRYIKGVVGAVEFS